MQSFRLLYLFGQEVKPRQTFLTNGGAIIQYCNWNQQNFSSDYFKFKILKNIDNENFIHFFNIKNTKHINYFFDRKKQKLVIYTKGFKGANELFLKNLFEIQSRYISLEEKLNIITQ